MIVSKSTTAVPATIPGARAESIHVIGDITRLAVVVGDVVPVDVEVVVPVEVGLSVAVEVTVEEIEVVFEEVNEVVLL